MSRESNVAVFEDTQKMYKTDGVLKNAIANSIINQIFVAESDKLYAVNKNRYDTPAKVFVSKKRTFEAAAAYKDGKVCVLNFASATNPGGGVAKGSSAQEECLCRISTLYPCLNTRGMWECFYTQHRSAGNPLHNDDCIYTPDVCVFKSDTASPALLKECDWYNVNVVTCAAPNLREKPANSFNPGEGQKVRVTDKELLAIHTKRLRRVLNIAASNGNEAIILGAFGCGAFCNPPQIVAKAMKEVVKEYEHAFKVIEFAVYCHPKDNTNYRIFERIFK